ncbi:hypothetical protein GCM10027271_46290 [Saccharopolyspora gloriosae]|uniref:ADP-ribose pyrophosphatase YjhB (NUDIX family) n=1 Tax=Saccharopolyspora gloriosae TaxID=455344 RepID=A0A840NGD4_9PSEU|nr:NUDIX domain-containing protein [Saccharopolyspora gloriosae]MBB5070071.1 ADP-ribose pyrophosphatase YjhB (NUDIX family) [Saccharopolyspora gloriosae]
MTARHHRVRVISFSIGALATTSGPTLGTALTAASPHDAATVADVLRRTLYPRANTTPELVEQLAAELSLPPRKVRCLLHSPRPLLLAPTARALLAGLRDAYPEVRLAVCSNVAAADISHADLIRAELGPLLDSTHFSHRTGLANGSGPESFEALAHHHGIAPSAVVHTGLDRHEDVHAPLLAGCRALLIHRDHTGTPRVADTDRYRTAADLPRTIAELRRWIPQSRPRPTLPVRASAMIRDAQGRLLLVRGPDDEQFFFPGGRCHPFGGEAPPEAMIRGVREELRLTATAGRLLWAGSSHAESPDGENEVHFLFEARLDGTCVPDPEPTEVAEYRWASNNEALHLLHPAEADRLVRISRGQHHGWQRRDRSRR